MSAPECECCGARGWHTVSIYTDDDGHDVELCERCADADDDEREGRAHAWEVELAGRDYR